MADAMRYLGVLKEPGGGGPGGGGGPVGGGGNADYSLRISKRTLRVDRKRRTKVRLSCGPTKGTQCKGVVLARRARRRRWDRRSFSITANKIRSVTVRIKKSAYRRLTRKKRIETTITLVTRGL